MRGRGTNLSVLREKSAGRGERVCITSLRRYYCGNPRCHCASNPAARHGPHLEWSYLKASKLHHRTLTSEQAEIMRRAIANQRKAKKLLRVWEAQTLNLIELTTPK